MNSAKIVLVNQIPEVNNKYSFSLADGIRSTGADIAVCGMKEDNWIYKMPFWGLFDSYSKKSDPISKLICYCNGYRNLMNYCLNNKVGVVHLQWYIFSPLDYLFIKKFKKKGCIVIVTIHDLLPFNEKPYDFYFYKKIYQNADEVISQAVCNKSDLVNKFGVEEAKIHYVPHGHYMKYAEFMEMKEAKKRLNIPLEKRVILFFGQIKKVKGVDVLINAIAHLKEKYPDLLCIIAGKVWKDNFTIYDALIKERHLEDVIRADVRFITDEEIKYYFNAAEMVTLPYRKIYQSGVVLLGAAYEKPLIATTEGEFVQVIQNGKTGLLVEAGNDKAFADAISWYLDNPAKALQFAKACKDDLNKRLSWEAIGESVVNIYNKV